jgi:hypothetical protein
MEGIVTLEICWRVVGEIGDEFDYPTRPWSASTPTHRIDGAFPMTTNERPLRLAGGGLPHDCGASSSAETAAASTRGPGDGSSHDEPARCDRLSRGAKRIRPADGDVPAGATAKKPAEATSPEELGRS